MSAGLLFDHAAQYVTATDVSFQEELRRWEAAGAVREWSGEVACLDARTRVAKPLEDGTGPGERQDLVVRLGSPPSSS